MPLPGRVEIGPFSYELTDDVATYNEVATSKDECDWGWCQYGKLRILVNPAQASMHKRSVVLHEVLHAVIALSDQRVDKEEEIIRAIAVPLLDVLRRNPDLVAYLTAEE